MVERYLISIEQTPDTQVSGAMQSTVELQGAPSGAPSRKSVGGGTPGVQSSPEVPPSSIPPSVSVPASSPSSRPGVPASSPSSRPGVPASGSAGGASQKVMFEMPLAAEPSVPSG